MMRRRTRRRLWFAGLLTSASASAVLVTVGLSELDGSITGFKKALALQLARQSARSLRDDIAGMLAAQLALLRGGGPEEATRYDDLRRQVQRQVEQLTAHEVPDWSSGLGRQLDSWCRQADIALAERRDHRPPAAEDVALLARQGNQMLVMLAVLDGQWADWADDLTLHGRRLRRRAVWLGFAAALSIGLAGLSAIGWLGMRRRR
jgi:hypothetical protein